MRLLLLIPLLFSCSKVYELEKKSGLYYIPNVDVELLNPREIDWAVGRKREENVSKGIRMSSKIPRLSDDAKMTLANLHGIDSWLIKVSRYKRGQSQPLGFFYINLNNITRNTKDFTINLYYHAAAVSKRFRLFHCPAFNHRLKTTRFDLEDRSIPRSSDLFIRPTNRFPGKASRLRFAPMVVSGGRNLRGVYHVDMSLYNSKSKMRYSNWFPVKESLHVTSESQVAVASCAGIREENNPLPESKMPSIKDLEIK